MKRPIPRNFKMSVLPCCHVGTGSWRGLILIFSLLYVIARPTLAQNYAVDWQKISGGSGTSTNAHYAITGTIGQADVGHLAGGAYTVDAGFWAFAAVVQNPGAPLLSIRLTAANTIAISWPSSATGFVLQSGSSVNATNWNLVMLPPSDDGITETVVDSPASGYQFFRLIKP